MNSSNYIFLNGLCSIYSIHFISFLLKIFQDFSAIPSQFYHVTFSHCFQLNILCVFDNILTTLNLFVQIQLVLFVN